MSRVTNPRRVCRRFNIKTAFKSGMTLRAQLSRVKDKLPTSMSSCVVYSEGHETFQTSVRDFKSTRDFW